MNLSLVGKNAVIGGSSQGIGAAVAQELAALGATCILLARNKESLQATVDGLDKAQDQQHQFHAIDFNDQAATTALIQTIVAHQPIHILINNSGGPASGPITEATPEQFLQAF